MYTLTDTFNDRVISRHRSVRAAVEARIKHARSLKHHPGDTSYVTYSITAGNGKDYGRDISDEVWRAEQDIYNGR